jgi:hypothetical protein
MSSKDNSRNLLSFEEVYAFSHEEQHFTLCTIEDKAGYYSDLGDIRKVGCHLF